MAEEALFQPFVGPDYRTPKCFPGRLLVVGESYYLKEEDKRADFTECIIKGLIRGGAATYSNTDYYRNVFYVLAGKRARDASQQEWADVWNSIAFYNFAQTTELSRPLTRPKREDWIKSKEPFRTVLSRLGPEYVLITGIQLCGYATKIEGARQHQSRPGVCLPTSDSKFAYARCIHHPSSRTFLKKRDECLRNVDDLLGRSEQRPSNQTQS